MVLALRDEVYEVSEGGPFMCSYASALHVGHARQHQEDDVFVDARRGLFGVLDGMGGQSTGGVAVRRACASFERSSAVWDDRAPLHEQLERALRDAAVEVSEYEGPSAAPWATTVTLAAFRGEWCVVASVGDTRAYAYRDGALTRLTRDHTLLDRYQRSHELTAEEVGSFTYPNVLVNCLGTHFESSICFSAWHLRPGDRLLLCSDGLYDFVDEADMASILSAGHPTQESVDALLTACLATEAGDNVSVLLVDSLELGGGPPDARIDDAWGELRSALHAPGEEAWSRVAQVLDAARGAPEWDELVTYVATSVERWPSDRPRPTPLRWMLDVWRDVRPRPELALCDTVYLPSGWAPPDAQWLELLTRSELLGLPELDPDMDKVGLGALRIIQAYAVLHAPAWVASIDAEIGRRAEPPWTSGGV